MKPIYLFRTPLIVLAIACLVTGSAHASPERASAQELALLAAAETAASRATYLVQALEPNAVKAANAQAERHGKRLVLHLKSGVSKNYDDKPECDTLETESECQIYILVAYINSFHHFVVTKVYYEAAVYILVDDTTGQETVLNSFPRYSPSGQHVLMFEGEERDDTVEIWHRVNHGFIREWYGAPYNNIIGSTTTYMVEHWFDENLIALQAKHQMGFSNPDTTTRFEMRHSAKGWKVIPVRE